MDGPRAEQFPHVQDPQLAVGQKAAETLLGAGALEGRVLEPPELRGVVDDEPRPPADELEGQLALADSGGPGQQDPLAQDLDQHTGDRDDGGRHA